MNKSTIGAFSIVALLILSFTVGMVSAYATSTTPFTVGSDGTVTATDADSGITYSVEGTAGATGSVTASVQSGNPQATASIPDGISLNKFLVITFDMTASDFIEAQITISYSDSDVANLEQPYAIYKYLPESDSYVQLFTTVDTTAKTMSVTLTSVDDPLLAIGGSATSEDAGIPTVSWIIVTVTVVIVVVLAVFIVIRWRKM